MPANSRIAAKAGWTWPLGVLAAFFCVLLVAGGASRADALGQVVIRCSAWLVLAAYVMLASKPDYGRVRVAAIILGAAVALTALQLIPLPPRIWTGLPGRAVFAEAAIAAGEPQPWRPLSISPSATLNALSSLVVPVVVLILMASVRAWQFSKLAGILLALVSAGALVGLMQFSGARYDNPFVNDIAGLVSGPFANRNHFALFIAIGCLLVPAWALDPRANLRWTAVVGTGLLALFVLLLLAIGSRSGIVLGLLGTIVGFAIVLQPLRRILSRAPKRVAIPIAAAVGTLFAGAIVASVTLDRDASLDRFIATEASADLRTQFVPIAIDLAGRYFPVGTGFGTFDPVFRMVEPDAILQTSYVNHAHSDWVELVLDGGAPAALLLLGAIGWWVFASVRAWRSGDEAIPARIGSGVIVLVLVASLTDYPARTPMILAMLSVGAAWLESGVRAERRSD